SFGRALTFSTPPLQCGRSPNCSGHTISYSALACNRHSGTYRSTPASSSTSLRRNLGTEPAEHHVVAFRPFTRMPFEPLALEVLDGIHLAVVRVPLLKLLAHRKAIDRQTAELVPVVAEATINGLWPGRFRESTGPTRPDTRHQKTARPLLRQRRH